MPHVKPHLYEQQNRNGQSDQNGDQSDIFPFHEVEFHAFTISRAVVDSVSIGYSLLSMYPKTEQIYPFPVSSNWPSGSNGEILGAKGYVVAEVLVY